MANNHIVPMKSLLEAGVHFGHRTRRWNPKMKTFIFTERNGIHIIDLQQTIVRLNKAYETVKETVSTGGIVLFVGTKKQAQDSVIAEATRCNMPYVSKRWLGGTLTNWRTIRQRIDYLLEIERQQARGEFTRLTKKEALMQEREIIRLNHRLGGLKEMRRLPNLLFVVDVRRDSLAVKEANVLGIPIIAMVDTNCDPDPIDHVIPSNDDAIRAVKLMNNIMATATLDGQAILNTIQAEEEEAAGLEEDQAMEHYLGPSTLAHIQQAAEEEVVEEVAKEDIVKEAKAVAVEAVEEPTEEPATVEAEEAVEAEEIVEAPKAAAAAAEVVEDPSDETPEEAVEATEEVVEA